MIHQSSAEASALLQASRPQVLRVEPLGPPRGEVQVLGAKNSALPLIAAALLVEEGVTEIHRVPAVEDVYILLEIVKGLGARVEADWRRQTVMIDASHLSSHTPDTQLVGRVRGSLMLMAPLLIRNGDFEIARPGGCTLGYRGFDQHLKGLRTLGAQVWEQDAMIKGACRRLTGSDIRLDRPTHTGTQQLILAAVRADGISVIRNAAREPEVATLCRSLVAMGASIRGIGSSEITIAGIERLRGAVVTCSSSRLETAWYAMAGCLPGGELTIRGAAAEAEPALLKLRQMGAELRMLPGGTLQVRAPRRLRECRAITGPYPEFPTDSQPHLLALACYAHGRTIVRETVFDERLRHVHELRQMGADILIRDTTAVVRGPRRLRGTAVVARDIQGGAGLVLAALGAEGPTDIHGFEQVLRGYPDLLERLGGACRTARTAA
ncbi:MAG: UDP-N-acetylglucosamine 1-carboxyvinyltransferase [Gemmataceae bacterium]|nr:UDP-N-acetylglucosamine 1-carboxyvinyltransferase [Gemmataceae bacterium]